MKTNKNATCEVKDAGRWHPISVTKALGLDRSEPKRCPECHGNVRLHRKGHGPTSPAHFEHLPKHDGCKHSHRYAGKDFPHPNPLR